MYTADPHVDPSARRFESIEYLDVLREGYSVMDATAISGLCMENALPIIVFDFREEEHPPHGLGQADRHPRARRCAVTVDSALGAASEKMDKAVGVLKEELAGVRTGRATPALLSRIVVDYYGTPVPIQQLASFSVPEPRTLMIAYDRNAISAMEKAIMSSDLGSTRNDGTVIRLSFPRSPRRRKELIKLVHHRGKARVAVRNIRRRQDELERLERDGSIWKMTLHAPRRSSKLTDKHARDRRGRGAQGRRAQGDRARTTSGPRARTLFEDLDKFFARSRTSTGPSPRRLAVPPNGRTSPRSRPPRRRRKPPEADAAPVAFETTTEDKPDQPELPAEERGAGEEDVDLFADEWRRTSDVSTEERGASPGASGETEEGVGSYLFETDEEDEELEGEEGRSGAAPAPQQLRRDPGRPEPLSAEDEVIREEAPDLEAVEAAADHFAESVRDEVEVEASRPLEPTEQVAIAALLGDEDEEESAEEAARTVGSAARASADQLAGADGDGVGGEREEAAERNVPTAFLTGIVLAALGSARSCSGPGRSRSSRASWSCSRRASSTSRCRSVTTSRPPRSAWSPARSCSAPATTGARTRCSPLWRCRCSARSCGSRPFRCNTARTSCRTSRCRSSASRTSRCSPHTRSRC